MLWNLLGKSSQSPQAFDNSSNIPVQPQNTQPTTQPVQAVATSTVMQAPVTTVTPQVTAEIVQPKLSEDEALEKLLSFEKKILNSTPPQNTHSQNEDDEETRNEPPEVLRARNALKLENPFRGV